MAVAVSTAKQLVGTWRLKAFERWSDGQVSYPMGEGARGYISYGPHGRMSVQIMRVDRAPLSAENVLQSTAEELKAVVAGYLSYAGTYEVDEAASTITHHIDVHLLPNAVGTQLKRRYELRGDTLTLYTAPDGGAGRLEGGRLTWERVE